MQTSQLLIIGNGFDLHCGLKSTYKDFFQNRILDTLNESFGVIQIKADVSGFWENLLVQYYKAFGNINYNWCDIETIIKETIITMICDNKNFLNNVLENVRSGKSPYDINTNNPVYDFLYRYCMVKCKLILHEMRILGGDKIYSLLIDNILQQLHAFEARFCRYIKDCIVDFRNGKKLNSEYIVNAMNLLANLTGFNNIQCKNIDDIIECHEELSLEKSQNVYNHIWQEKHQLLKRFDNLRSVNILSFNYTSLFDILEVESPCLYSNVHGKLCMDKCDGNCTHSNVIFGIDDTVIQAQYENSEIHKFSKTYRKMLNANVDNCILPSKDKPLKIKFYGHSLSEADYSYFQSIFDYYNIYENNNVSLMFYYSKGYEQTDEVYRLINTYGKTLSNKDQGKNLTHKLLLENRLKIVEIP